MEGHEDMEMWKDMHLRRWRCIVINKVVILTSTMRGIRLNSRMMLLTQKKSGTVRMRI